MGTVRQWGSLSEVENRRRVRLALAAYAYEILNTELMSDAEFDFECSKVDLGLDTGPYDNWWRLHFDPSTGIWIHQHPDKKGLESKVRELLQNRK